MSSIVFSEHTRRRIAKWMQSAKPINETPTWIERRLAVDIGGHTYLLVNGQVFQCAHCGQYDPQWSVTEVLAFLKETMGVEPYELEVECSVARKS
jgi:hypothetical protein